MQGTVKGIIDWYNSRCRKNHATGHWEVPATSDLIATGYIATFNWPRMLHDEALANGLKHIVSIVPTYFMDEADPNQFDRPRLDFVVTFNDDITWGPKRYHPSGDIDPNQLAQATFQRRNRLAKLRRTFNRDWA